MDERPGNRWDWEDVNPNRSAGDGNFAKLFRNQQDKKPGFLAQDAPSLNAYFLAREVIQNAWDAALQRRALSLSLSLSDRQISRFRSSSRLS